MRGLVPRSVWIVVAAVVGVHLACLGGYGYFRDELYFIACGQHLAWGYVDQPPLIALIARLADAASWGSLTLFRLPANLAHAATVLLAAALARRLGAGSFGSTLTAICTAAAPVFLANGHLLTMNAFEPLLWTAVGWVVFSILEGANLRRWLGAGALIGVGVLNKHSMVFFAVCLVLALLTAAAGRRILLSRWAAAGAGLAGLIVLPHALWQVSAGLPMLELLRNGQAYKNSTFNLLSLWQGQLLEMGFLASVVALAGLGWLVTRLERPSARVLGLACVLLELLFIALKAKPYYLAPLYPVLFAGGGAAFDAWLARWPRRRWALPVAVVLGGLVATPMALPLLPVETTERILMTLGVEAPRTERMEYRALPQHLADQFGWPELVDSIADVVEQLPAEDRSHVAIYLRNYGEAGAVDFFGAARGLPAASSGHNSYFLWGPHGDGAVVITVGGEAADHVRYYEQVELVGQSPSNPHGLPYEDARPIFVLRRPRKPLAEIWPSLKLFI